MTDLELDLMNMIKNPEFRKVNNVFREQLKTGIEQIKTITKSLFLQINLETLIKVLSY